jgi:double-stranded uracil-DNA glycosylase
MNNRTEVLPDVLIPGLKVVFCGTAVGNESEKRRAYYAGPGNKFWKIQAKLGLTPCELKPDEYPKLPNYRIGLTDLVKKKSGTDEQLSKNDFDVASFRKKLKSANQEL